jgi:hypothetical protein
VGHQPTYAASGARKENIPAFQIFHSHFLLNYSGLIIYFFSSVWGIDSFPGSSVYEGVAS